MQLDAFFDVIWFILCTNQHFLFSDKCDVISCFFFCFFVMNKSYKHWTPFQSIYNCLFYKDALFFQEYCYIFSALFFTNNYNVLSELLRINVQLIWWIYVICDVSLCDCHSFVISLAARNVWIYSAVHLCNE